MSLEKLPIAQEWEKCNGELRSTIINALATKGSPLSEGDLMDGPIPQPLSTLFAESIGDAARYHSLYPEKELKPIEVMASIRNFTDQVRNAELAGQDSLIFHYVDGSSEKLTPRAANARLIGFTIYALDRRLIKPNEIVDLTNNNAGYWDQLLEKEPDKGFEMLREIFAKNPDHPFNQHVRELMPSLEQPDIMFQSNPALQFVADAHKMYLHFIKSNPHRTILRDTGAALQASVELLGMYKPKNDQPVKITSLAFLGKDTISRPEYMSISAAISKYLYETKYPTLISSDMS